ncbi:MAG: dephospho-CoA kinase [Chloroflexota bacterium]|nr:dephospho-CoA kinase [Dehalococcoidia bacterium]MDW8253136.1 dephospho-CoA kinase [Chloroflexota bacterium]
MLVVGLTGGIASGKSTVAAMLRERGAAIIDADALGHRVLERGSDSWATLVATFGEGILSDNGEIDRRRLGAIVFADPEQLKRLNAISHPRIRRMALDELAALRARGDVEVAVVEAALLFEGGWDDFCDEVWVVYVPEEIALARLRSRNGLTDAQARERIRAQMPIDEKRARANIVLDNSGSLADLEAQVEEAWAAALRRARGEAPPLSRTGAAR